MRRSTLPAMVALIVLVGCAQTPAPSVSPAPATVPLPAALRHADPVERAIALHRQRALRLAEAGDLGAATSEWHVVALLAPEDDGVRRDYEASRQALRRAVQERLQQGNAAMKNGDNDAAAVAMTRALVLDPENAEAAKAMREIERQKVARVQSDRIAKLKPVEPDRSPRNSTADAEAYDVEQRIEIFRAGDIAGGLREFRAFVDAHPGDRSARQRIGAAVYERAQELEQKGSREQAISLGEQAASLRGDTPAEWSTRMQALRKGVSDEYYEKGMRAYRADLASAIKFFEASLRFDPQNVKASSKLHDARLAQEKLKSM